MRLWQRLLNCGFDSRPDAAEDGGDWPSFRWAEHDDLWENGGCYYPGPGQPGVIRASCFHRLETSADLNRLSHLQSGKGSRG